VWANITAPNGMLKDKGGKITTSVNFNMQVELLTPDLVPTGTVLNVSDTLSGRSQEEKATTLEATLPYASACRVRLVRTTPYDWGFAGAIVDEIKWVDLYGVTPVSNPHFGNKTTIQTQTKATVRATSARSRQLNCRASRLIPTCEHLLL